MPDPWVCQKTPSRPPVFAHLPNGLEYVLDAQVLVVLGDDLFQPALAFVVEDIVLQQVQEARRRAGRAHERFQRDDARFALAVDLFPGVEMLPRRGETAQHGLAAVGEHDETVVPEEVGDGVQIVAEVVRVGVAQFLDVGLEFAKQERQAVDEADQVGAAGVQVAGDPQLLRHQKIVVRRVLPVHDADDLQALAARVVLEGDLDAVLEQRVDLTVGLDGRQRAAAAGELLGGQRQRFGRQVGVEPRQRRPQAREEHHLPAVLAAQVGAAECGLCGVEDLVVGIHRLPAQCAEEGQRGGFEGGFGINRLRHHETLKNVDIAGFMLYTIITHLPCVERDLSPLRKGR